jgi:GTP:adenosylcobinamide-phosphate guanylyltransferase
MTTDYSSIKTAFIAGGGSQKFGGVHKSLVDICGKPSIEHVIDSLTGSGVEKIYIWTDYFSEIKNLSDKKGADIRVYESKKGLLDSFLYVYKQHLRNDSSFKNFKGDYGDWGSIREYSVRENALIETPVLVTSCDVPLINPSEIITFLNNYSLKDDYLIGFTQKEKLDEKLGLFDLKNDFYSIGGTINNFQYTREHILRINNLHLIKPLKLDIETYDLFQTVFNFRHFSKCNNWLNISKGIKNLKQRKLLGITKMLYHGYLSQSKNSPKKILKHRKHLDIDSINSLGSKLLNLNFRIDINGDVGSLIDLDDEETYSFVNSNFEKLKKTL